jgi:predicted metalloprotease
MRWTSGGSNSDIEDRRGLGGGGGFGFGRAPMGLGGAVVLLVLSLLFRRNFFAFFSGGGGGTPSRVSSQPAAPASESPGEHQEVEFVKFVLNDAQATWDATLQEQARVPYRHARLVLFRDATQSGCGYAQAATGPFYCPEDEKVYIDLSFYDELKQRFGAPGEFAQAYVIAHEIGHHVQKITGIEPKVHRLMQQDPDNAGRYSVRLELQADCLAGVWGHSTEQRNILENGDVEAGLNAAAAIGDDRLARMGGRAVNPDNFTHGSSKDRVAWFRRGLESGKVSSCNTFG